MSNELAIKVILICLMFYAMGLYHGWGYCLRALKGNGEGT